MGLDKLLTGSVHRFPVGGRNLITDVPGVAVGHCTVIEAGTVSGVTAIVPQPDNLFTHKLPAAVHVINGFGKSIGLVQIAELGNIETPILLTNTFSVGTCFSALAKRMMAQNPAIGDTTGTVNPIVMECNDSGINDIRAMGITEIHAYTALDAASTEFSEGAHGAGTGMTCYGLKGGIGSASRVIGIKDKHYTFGCLVLTNFGSMRDLVYAGEAIGTKLAAKLGKLDIPLKKASGLTEDIVIPEQGSIIIVLATDAPLSTRQLERICRRAQSGIARTGSYTANGSGEIALAFSTANRIPHESCSPTRDVTVLSDEYIDLFFSATVSVVEESVLSSLVHARTTSTRRGSPVYSLNDAISLFPGETFSI